MNKKIVDVSLRVLVSSTLVLGLVPAPALAEVLDEGTAVAGEPTDVPDNDVDANGEGDAEEVVLNYCYFVNTDWFEVFSIGGSVADYIEVRGYDGVIDAKNYDLVFTDSDGNDLTEEPAAAGEYQVYAKAKVGNSKTDPISYTLVDPNDIGCYSFGASDTLVGETLDIWGSLNYWDVTNNNAVDARLTSDDFQVVSYAKDGQETEGLPTEAGSYILTVFGSGDYTGTNSLDVTLYEADDFSHASIEAVSKVLGNLQFKVTYPSGDEADAGEYTLYYNTTSDLTDPNWTSAEPTTAGDYYVYAQALSSDGVGYVRTSPHYIQLYDANDLSAGSISVAGPDWSTFACGDWSMKDYIEVKDGNGDAVSAEKYDLVFADSDGEKLESEPTGAGQYRVCAKAKDDSGYSGETSDCWYTLVDPSDIGCYFFWASGTLVGEVPSIENDSLGYWDLDKNESVSSDLSSDDFEIVSYTSEGGAVTTAPPNEAGNYTVRLKGAGDYKGEKTLNVTFRAATELAHIDVVSDRLGSLQFKVTDMAGDEVDSSEYTLYFQAEDEDDWTTDLPSLAGYYYVEARANGGSEYSGSISLGFDVVDGKALNSISFKDWESTFGCGSSIASRIEVKDNDGNIADTSNYDLVFVGWHGYELDSEPTEAGEYCVYAKAKDDSGFSGQTDKISYTLVDPTDIRNYDLDASNTLAGEAPSISGNCRYWDIESDQAIYKNLSSDNFNIVSYASEDGAETTKPPTEAGTYNVKLEGTNGFSGTKDLTVTYYAASDFSHATLSLGPYEAGAYDLSCLEIKVTDGAGDVVDPSKYTVYFADSDDAEGKPEKPATAGWYYVYAKANEDSGYTGRTDSQCGNFRNLKDLGGYRFYNSNHKLIAGDAPVIGISLSTWAPLVEGQDYVIGYYEDKDGNNLGSSVPTEPGTYYAVLVPVEGSGYHGTARVEFTSYAANDLALCTWVNVGWSAPLVDGTVKLGGRLVAQDGTALKEGVDYTLEFRLYQDGDPVSEVTEQGDYYYDAKAIEGSGWTGDTGRTSVYVYTSNDLSYWGMTTVADSAIVGDLSTIKVTYNGDTLVYGEDYEVEGVYTDSDGTEPLEGGVPTSEGSYCVKVRGIGDYSGTATSWVRFFDAKSISWYRLLFNNEYATKGQKDSLSFTLMDWNNNESDLVLGKDYVLEYSTDTGLTWSAEMPEDAEWFSVRAKAKDGSGFTGTSQSCGVYFVEDTSLKAAEVSFGDGVSYKSSRYYADYGTGLTPVLTLGGKQLIEGRDYEVTKTGSDKPGSVRYEFTGKGGYSDSTYAYVDVTLSLGSSSVSVSDIANVEYTGKEQKPSVIVRAGDLELKAGEDYYLVYENNVEAGTATVTIKGMSEYVTGEVKKSFQIVDSGHQTKSISGAKVTAGEQTYTGSALTPDVKVVLDGKELVKGTDYEVVYKDNVDAGTATVTVTGTGGYTGTATGTFTIKAADASKATVNAAEQTWTGSAVEPAVTVTLGGKTLTNGTDYTASYSNNTAVGTATVTVNFKGNYSGAATGEFTIKAADISGASVSVARQTYDGSALTPAVTVKLGDKTLANGTDYAVKYENNTGAGTAKVTVTGIGNYSGSKTTTFTIDAADASKATVKVANQAWTGKALTPVPTVTLDNRTLVNGTDYDVEYSNNTAVGTATVKVTFKGNYAGTAEGTFRISATAESIAKASVTTGDQTYTGSALTPNVTVKLGDKVLTKDVDYTVEYSNNTDAGTATVAVMGKGNYVDTATGEFTIKAADASKAAVTAAEQTWTGSALTSAVTVTLGGKTLTKDKDYTVSYSNNTAVGTATATVTFKGNYSGKATGTFKINAASISSASVTAENQTYSGSPLTPAVTVKLDNKTLVNGADYTVKYESNMNVGTAKVTVTGEGNYTGAASGTFKINAKDASRAQVNVPDQTWTGLALTPAVTVTLDGKTLARGTDYAVEYSNNTNAGTATAKVTFKGNYAGTAERKFAIKAAGISGASVSVARQTYNGSPLKPAVTVKLGNKTLANGTDYTVKYESNTDAGTAKVTVTGKGNYSGAKTATFTIDAADASKATVTASEQAWTGNAIKAPVTVKLGNKPLVEGTDYTVAYSNNVNAGTANVTVTFKGNYKGTAKGTFKINAKDASRAQVKVADQAWTGKALTPAPTVTFGGKTLKQGTDYTVAYSSNVNAGAATVTVTFKGNYAGKATGTFKITKTETIARVTMTRLYNRWSGEHLYTSDAGEIKKLVAIGWKSEGTAWVAPSKSSTPVYRLYNPYSGDHHYTTSKKEYDECAEHGWNKEGIAWYSDDAKSVPLYRGFNRYVTVGTHHYTTDKSEMDNMVEHGWKCEGVAWYGLK